MAVTAASVSGDNQTTNNVVAIPSSSCELLPRIAEEKDSPTSTQDGGSVSEGFMPAIEEYAESESSLSSAQTLEKPSSKEQLPDRVIKFEQGNCAYPNIQQQTNQIQLQLKPMRPKNLRLQRQGR